MFLRGWLIFSMFKSLRKYLLIGTSFYNSKLIHGILNVIKSVISNHLRMKLAFTSKIAAQVATFIMLIAQTEFVNVIGNLVEFQLTTL